MGMGMRRGSWAGELSQLGVKNGSGHSPGGVSGATGAAGGGDRGNSTGGLPADEWGDGRNGSRKRLFQGQRRSTVVIS